MPTRVIDLHIDTLLRGLEAPGDLAAATPQAMADLPRMKAAGVRAAVWAACDDLHLEGPASTARVVHLLAVGLEMALQHPDQVRLVRHAGDLAACLQGGPAGMLLAVEGAHALGGSLEMLEAFGALGVRLLTLTWNQANPFAAGCRLTGPDTGLSPLGAELLAVAQATGIVIDLAHASARTFADVLPRLEHPPLVSHTACAALRPHPRNLDDAQLREIGARGGLVGITLCPGFLAAESQAADLGAVVAHLRHALAVAGEGSVAVGSDFDGVTALPAGLAGAQDWPRLWEALAEAGVAPEAIERVAWRNAAEFLAQSLPAGPAADAQGGLGASASSREGEGS